VTETINLKKKNIYCRK